MRFVLATLLLGFTAGRSLGQQIGGQQMIRTANGGAALPAVLPPVIAQANLSPHALGGSKPSEASVARFFSKQEQTEEKKSSNGPRVTDCLEKAQGLLSLP